MTLLVCCQNSHRHVVRLLDRPIFKHEGKHDLRVGLKPLEERGRLDIRQISHHVLVLEARMVYLRGERRAIEIVRVISAGIVGQPMRVRISLTCRTRWMDEK